MTKVMQLVQAGGDFSKEGAIEYSAMKKRKSRRGLEMRCEVNVMEKCGEEQQILKPFENPYGDILPQKLPKIHTNMK